MIFSTSIRLWFRYRIQWVKANPLLTILCSLLVVLFSAFVAVIFFKTVEVCIGRLLGSSDLDLFRKKEILTFLGIGMGGILLALQAVIANRRAKALEDTAKAQADTARAQAKATEEQAKANQNTEQGQRQERLKNAIEHLGHASDSVRLGGAYELFHLAQDTKELRQTVLDILCAHIRRTTSERKYREKYKWKPSEEIQSLLTLLFVQDHTVFEGLHINLKGSRLNGADLSRADLRWAELSWANLEDAFLSSARLHEAVLFQAKMDRAYLVGAHLHGTSLYGVQLRGANLGKAKLPGACLFEAQLQGVNLAAARLQGAILGGVQLQGAYLVDAQMHGVGCEEDIGNSFEERLRQMIGKESDLSWVTFAGGLSQEDVDSLVKDCSDEEADRLRERLISHIGKPASNELPEDSGVITGAYTEEEAEQWIAEFEEAMSEVPKTDNGQ